MRETKSARCPGLFRLARSIALVALLLDAGSVLALATSPPGINMQVPTGQLRISNDTVDQVLPIVMTLDGVAPTDVVLAKIAVLLDGVPLSAEGAAGFAVEKALEPAGAAYLANIQVLAGRVTHPGNYEVWISAQDSKPAGFGPQIFKVTIEHPTATVAALAPIKIHLVEGDSSVNATPLQLELSGDVVRLDHPVLGPVVFPDAAEPVAGSLELEPPIASFASGATINSTWKVHGAFPLGTLDGFALLSGEQLKEPALVKVSLKNRRSFEWLYGAAALGLLCGFLIKTALQGFLDSQRARSDGLSMLAESKRQIAMHPDERFVASLKPAIENLEAALKNDKKQVPAATTQLKDQLGKALTDLWASQSAAKTSIEEWLASLDVTRDLPSKINSVVVAATASIRAADALVSTSVGRAKNALDDATRKLQHDLLDSAGSWKRSALDSLSALTDAKTLILPAEVSQVVSADASDLAKDLAASVDPAAAATAKSVGTMLDQVERLRIQMKVGLVEPAAERLAGVIAILLQRLSPEIDEHPTTRSGIESALAAVQQKLGDCAIEQRLAMLAPGQGAELQTLDDKIREIFSTLKAPKKKDRDAINASVKQHAYLNAATRLREALSALPPASHLWEGAHGLVEGIDLRDGGLFAGDGAFEPGLNQRSRVFLVPTRSVEFSRLAPFPAVQDIQLSLARARLQIAAAEFVQTVATGLLFGLIAYVIYADQFVGTFKELIGIFFWAFGIDLTVAKLLDTAKALK